jgi:hypothetical protein
MHLPAAQQQRSRPRSTKALVAQELNDRAQLNGLLIEVAAVEVQRYHAAAEAQPRQGARTLLDSPKMGRPELSRDMSSGVVPDSVRQAIPRTRLK